jgi:hypothetical protein
LLATKAKAGTPTPTTSVVLQASKQARTKLVSVSGATQLTKTKVLDRVSSAMRSLSPFFPAPLSIPKRPQQSWGKDLPTWKFKLLLSTSVCVCARVRACLSVSLCLSLCVSQNPNQKSQLKSYSQSLLCASVSVCGIFCVEFYASNPFTLEATKICASVAGVQRCELCAATEGKDW